MIQEFPFGQWLPDAPDYQNPGLVAAENVLPVGGGYEPIRAPVATGVSVTGTARGMIRVVRPDTSQLIVIGTADDLYTVSGGVVVPSGLEDVNVTASWRFVPFGKMLWAFAAGHAPCYLPDVTTDTEFVPHPGTAPKAAAAARVADFIVVGDLEDIDLSVDPYRIRWSRFNDPAGDWADDIATQAGAVAMPSEYGRVMAIAGGDYGIILQRYGVSRLDYTGGAAVFSKREISSGRGCAAPASVVQVAGVTYFLSDDGFFKTDGASIAPIASQRVFSWFLSAIKEEAFESVQGAVDWASRCIVWSFSAAEGVDGFTRQIIYSWESDRWSSATLTLDWLADTIKTGMSLEQVSAVYPDLDAMPLSLDSPKFLARGRSLTAVIAGFVCDLSGAALRARIQTGEFQPATGFRCCVSGVAVLAENADANSQVALGARDPSKGSTVRWTRPQTEGRDGFARPRLDGRYVRAEIIIPAGANWAKAAGIQVEYHKTGRV